MDNPTLSTAAEILEVSEESLKDFPEHIANSMIAAMEMVDPDTEEECRILHDNLRTLWQQGCIYKDMQQIAEETGADFDTLMSLDYQSQLGISFDYAVDVNEQNENAVKNVYDNINKALNIVELPMVAKLLDIDYDKLREKYSRYVWEQLCGAYAMLYDENGDNSELITELNRIITEVGDNEKNV